MTTVALFAPATESQEMTCDQAVAKLARWLTRHGLSKTEVQEVVYRIDDETWLNQLAESLNRDYELDRPQELAELFTRGFRTGYERTRISAFREALRFIARARKVA